MGAQQNMPTRRIVQPANSYEANIDIILKLSDKRKHIKSTNELDLIIIETGQIFNHQIHYTIKKGTYISLLSIKVHFG